MLPAEAVQHYPSPNHGARAPDKPTDILLLHYTGMPTASGALEWLSSPASQVSSHYLIDEEGGTFQLVDESRRAWHAGKSVWAGETDINSRSIGIELVHPGHEHGYRAFAEVQIVALIILCRDILDRHPIPPCRVLAHSDVAPDRKEDPGELFPWPWLHSEGIGHWAPPASLTYGPSLRLGDRGRAVDELKAKLRQYGYDLGDEVNFGHRTEAAVRAFQRHFRPARVDGLADRSTVATLNGLIAALPARA